MIEVEDHRKCDLMVAEIKVLLTLRGNLKTVQFKNLKSFNNYSIRTAGTFMKPLSCHLRFVRLLTSNVMFVVEMDFVACEVGPEVLLIVLRKVSLHVLS